MLEAVLAEGDELGFHTLRGAAHEAEGRTPYAPLTEALDPLAARRPELIGALSDRTQVALSRLLPSVRRPHGALEEEVDRRVVFRAVAELLGQAASERGVVVAIDDLNHADEATAALVHHLARSAPTSACSWSPRSAMSHSPRRRRSCGRGCSGGGPPSS